MRVHNRAGNVTKFQQAKQQTDMLLHRVAVLALTTNGFELHAQAFAECLRVDLKSANQLLRGCGAVLRKKKGGAVNARLELPLDFPKAKRMMGPARR